MRALSRDKCPPLTDAVARGWFPYADYDLVIVDSFDPAAEGKGEQDSSKPPGRSLHPLTSAIANKVRPFCFWEIRSEREPILEGMT
jgi:hypothetical protein